MSSNFAPDNPGCCGSSALGLNTLKCLTKLHAGPTRSGSIILSVLPSPEKPISHPCPHVLDAGPFTVPATINFISSLCLKNAFGGNADVVDICCAVPVTSKSFVVIFSETFTVFKFEPSLSFNVFIF